jgi:hypothetical protein
MVLVLGESFIPQLWPWFMGKGSAKKTDFSMRQLLRYRRSFPTGSLAAR